MELNYKQRFIKFMVENGVLTFGEFTLKSGRKAPYFINTGNYKTGAQLARLGEYYAECIAGNNIEGETLVGPAYKGIPLAVTTAVALWNNHGKDLNYCFDRKEAKDHGEGGSIVGYKPKDGDRIIIIEDVITAGTAVRETMPVLKGCGDVKVNDMFISVNRCEVGQTPGKTAIMEVQEEFGIKVHALVTVQDIYEYLKEQGTYGDVLPAMEKYMADYCVL